MNKIQLVLSYFHWFFIKFGLKWVKRWMVITLFHFIFLHLYFKAFLVHYQYLISNINLKWLLLWWYYQFSILWNSSKWSLFFIITFNLPDHVLNWEDIMKQMQEYCQIMEGNSFLRVSLIIMSSCFNWIPCINK